MLKKLFKIFSAGIVAFIILSLFSTFYYNVPRRIESKTKSTDYVWESDTFLMRATEGFSYGKTDPNGFNNVKIPDDINILMMGSSQMEGFNVLPDENTTYKLNELLSKSSSLSAYNIAISGHTIVHCVNNIENAMAEFSPTDYIIIEMQQMPTDLHSLEKAVSSKYERTATADKGIMYKLQKSDYLRLLYSQYKSYKNGNNAATENLNNVSFDKDKYEPLIDAFIKKAKKAAGNCKLIIFFDAAISIDDKNNVLEREKDDYYLAFTQSCKNNDVIFMDMHECFKNFYVENHILPHGFSNTHIGYGHLNKYGHSIIANALYNKIMELEAK